MLKTTRTGEKLRMVTDRAVAVELLPKVVAMLDKLAKKILSMIIKLPI